MKREELEHNARVVVVARGLVGLPEGTTGRVHLNKAGSMSYVRIALDAYGSVWVRPEDLERLP